MPALPLLPNYIFTTPASVIRAVLIPSAYGQEYDWAHATVTDITGSAVISPLSATETGSEADSTYTQTHFVFLALPTVDIVATDRVSFNPGNGLITTFVDGDPFVWSDQIGRPHHIEARLKILIGV
jgi:hypothetical protein